MNWMTQMGQEEYIWAMRTGNREEPESSKKISQHLLQKSKSVYEATISTDDQQTKVMASLVPDEVICNVDDYRHRQYDACFLFGDVSGFTELCEKYTKTGISGPSRMTQVLNKYLGSMVQEVMSHGGDVLKFSGDAFLAIFKSTETETLRDAVHEAIDCALVIQKNYGSYLTDVGVAIRVKLAISAGLVTFALIGNVATSHYVVVGRPIWDVKAAEHISSAGDIIVAPAAWNYISANEYLYQEMPDTIHVKILGVGPNWRSVQRNVKQEKITKSDSLSQVDTDTSDTDALSEITIEGTDEFSIRPAVNYAVRLKIKEALRRFIIAPVMKSIDKDEPIEYLTEMRQTVIVFINVKSHSLTTEETVVLANKTYKIVCRVVHKMKGCVNKVSLFDKDLMFVVIFGLRGLKHELECQVALRCATECHTAISDLPGVLTASIGITTGKTYCGVFGHTLRREYTVISLVVNKAARLMVAYEGKVTCDRDTFLHSKLESRHFILQDFKPLKGISHPGPVYEFREVGLDHDVVHKINACPILGREENINLYKHLLKKFLKTTELEKPQYKMFLLNGEARQGKTRLLDELVYVTPAEVPVTNITLTKNDYKTPFETMRLIFYPCLFLTNESPQKEKEQRLRKVLKNMKAPDLLFVLNDVFGVDFQKSSKYPPFDEEQTKRILKKIIKILLHSCFITFWILAIDDCDFIDEESLKLLPCLFDTKTIFIIATISRCDRLNRYHIAEPYTDARVKTVFLTPIERLYLGALACQILDVYAISPELENAIQTKSHGNPGWIESYLISLIQDKALYIVKCTLSQIHDLGLVSPPLYMMARLTDRETKKWQHIMEERRPSLDSTKEPNDWKRYIDSCRDSYLNVTVREQMEAVPTDSKVPVCVIGPNFSPSSEETELSMDAIILRTFDSLSFYEQILVKCSATLGYEFFRDMLFYVVAANDHRKLALAVQKLFEMRVISCAKGNFLDSGDRVAKERLWNPHEETEVKCHCRGIQVDFSCLDLPKYASCGYMQFQSSLFREITYNLLTDNQKKDFHNRAIRYLERETRKCKSCGGGYFQRILGPKHDQGFISVKEKTKHSLVSAWDDGSAGRQSRVSVQSWSQMSAGAGGFDDRSLSKPSALTINLNARKSISTDRGLLATVSMTGIKPIIKPFLSDKSKNMLGITMINKLKDSFSLTRTFSSEDLTDCQCQLILCTTYAQLIEHGKGAGELTKMIEAMLSYADLCIVTSNIALAMTTLDEALVVLSKKAQEKIENMWKLSLIRAKIYILIGYARLELGHLNQAFDNLHKALAQYEITFPKGISKQMKIYGFQWKQFFGFYVSSRIFVKSLDHWGTVYANNLSECLSHLCTLYMIREQWEDAKMAACWSLVKALESFSDFKIICTACANMLKIALHYGRKKMCIALEVHSLRLCHIKQDSIGIDDIKCVCKLYSIIFLSRFQRSEIEKAIHIGYVISRLGSSLSSSKIVVPIIPLMAQGLLASGHFINTQNLLQELDYLTENDTDRSGKIWYYALCLGVQIETGFTIVHYNDCEHFYQFEGDTWRTIIDKDASRRLFTIMWLWCLRNEQYEAASIWCLKTEEFKVVTEKDSLANKMTSLYLLEGLIIYLVSQMDRRNISAVTRTNNEVKHLIKALGPIAKKTKFLQPRLYHLKAYYHYVVKNDNKVSELIAKATRIADEQGNTLETQWMEHSEKAWSKNLSREDMDFWKEHAEADTVIDFDEIDSADKLGFYTLPTPIYM